MTSIVFVYGSGARVQTRDRSGVYLPEFMASCATAKELVLSTYKGDIELLCLSVKTKPHE